MKLPNKLFVNASFSIALMNSKDADHAKAVELQKDCSEQNIHKVTSDSILLELCDGLAKLNSRSFAISLVDLIEQDSSFQIIPASTEITLAVWSLFTSRPDKEWGLTDCTSCVIMEKLKLFSVCCFVFISSFCPYRFDRKPRYY